jgi:integrase
MTSDSAQAAVGENELRVHFTREAGDGIKAGQPSLYWHPSMRIAEPQTAYLLYFSNISRSVPRWRNRAYQLSYWFNYLVARGVVWQDASTDDLLHFRDAMQVAISEQTGKEVCDGTVAQRMIAVIDFYEWAEREAGYRGSLTAEFSQYAEAPNRPRDEDALAHTGGGQHLQRRLSKFIPKADNDDSTIRPLELADLRAVLRALGPLPSEQDDSDARPCRDRLIAEWQWAVGLRDGEWGKLKIHPIQTAPPGAAEVLMTVRGKGRKARNVRVPGWLVEETLSYIDGERAGVLNAAGLVQGKEQPSEIFLVGADHSRRGKPLSVRRFQAVFAASCIEAGLIRHVDFVDSESGHKTVRRVPMHRPHDLRHTYAVFTYWAEVAAGNSEPWKKIQAQLGHKNLATTVNTYLKHVGGRNPFKTASVRDLIGLPRIIPHG